MTTTLAEPTEHYLEPIKTPDDMAGLVGRIASLAMYLATEGNAMTNRVANTIVQAGEGVFLELVGKDAYAAGYEVGSAMSDAATYIGDALANLKEAQKALQKHVDSIHQVRARYSANQDALGI